MGWLKRLPPLTRVLLGLVLVLVILTNTLLTWIDRTPYEEKAFYDTMSGRLDSLHASGVSAPTGRLKIGWSQISLTPQSPQPLAGYGGRDPMIMQGVHDSVYVRTMVLEK